MISIIIPTHNRADNLASTLRSITGLRHVENMPFETIVIDNGSTDNTKQVCQSFEDLIPNFRYYFDPVPGLLTGRHKGAECAQGDILSFLDDDVELSSTWLEGIASAFERPDVHLATGPNLPKYEVYPPAWLDYFWVGSGYGGKQCGWLSLLDLGDKEMYVDANYVWGLNFSIRKQTLFELEGFHPDCIPSHLQQFQGDGETALTMKANAKGYKSFYTSKAMLYHLVSKERVTLKYFEKRAFYQGVCDSFADIRKSVYSNQADSDTVSAKNNPAILTRVKSQIKGLLKKNQNVLPEEVENINRALDNKHKEGYAFHQQAFKNDSAVREWVLKANYMDYALPLTHKPA